MLEQAIYHSLSHAIAEVARGKEVSILKKIGVILQVMARGSNCISNLYGVWAVDET